MKDKHINLRILVRVVLNTIVGRKSPLTSVERDGAKLLPLVSKKCGEPLNAAIVKKGELLTSFRRWGGGRLLLLHARRGNAFAPQLEVLKQVYEREGGAHFTLGLERRRRILNFEF